MNELKVIQAKVQDENVENSTFNVLLSFKNGRHAKLYCREVNDGIYSAYNIDVVGGKCPCCGKPNCSSLFAKRQNLLQEAQIMTNFPRNIAEVKTV